MPAGRPTNYRSEYAEEARKLCEAGATDIELADHFGVTARTIYAWKNANPEFLQALKVGKESTDDRVERSLLERATGYERDDLDIRVIDGRLVKTVIRRWVPPDTTAAIFWLKNRRPAQWRDKTEQQIDGTMSVQRVVREVVDPCNKNEN